MNKLRITFIVVISLFAFSITTLAEALQREKTLADALQEGDLSGQVATYYELSEGQDEDSFAVATLKLKYETAKWNNLQVGAELYTYSALYNEFDGDEDSGGLFKDFDRANSNDRGNGAENTSIAISEIYLKYHFSEKSFMQIGRWAHSQASRKHLEDKQSEGFNIQYNDIEQVSIHLGLISQTAEFDYDDFEDWGDGSKSGDADFNDDSYGNADDFLLFLDIKYDFNEKFSINPYIYYQGQFATLLGSDFIFAGEINEDLKVGLDSTIYTVQTDGDLKENSGSGSQVISFLPWLKVSKFKFGTGITHFSEGLSLPRWFNNHLVGFDQKNQYPKAAHADGDKSNDDTTAVQATVEYKFKKFKIRYGIQQWKGSQNELEQELRLAYKFNKELDFSLRLFAIDVSENKDDYEKIEARLRYRF
mgnify:CR=1 FL=1